MKKQILRLTIAVAMVSLVSSCEKKEVKDIEIPVEFFAGDEGGGDEDGDLPIRPLVFDNIIPSDSTSISE